jgi:NAD(P)H dehydrogenase (quinone)
VTPLDHTFLSATTDQYEGTIIMIIVTGASGQLGKLVVRELLDRVPADQIVAAVRDPEKVPEFAARGVVIRQCEYDDPASLERAFLGADKALLISGNDFARSGEQHAAVVEAARAAGVGLLAYTSLAHADISTLLVALAHKHTEPIIRESGVPFAMLRNNLYFEHFGPAIRTAVATGTLTGSMGDGLVASATRSDLAAAAAAVLTGEGHENATYELSAQVAWTLEDLADDIADAAGKPIELRRVSFEEHLGLLTAAGLPPMMAEIFVDTYRGIVGGELAGTSDDLARLVGRPPMSLEESVVSVLGTDAPATKTRPAA